MVLGGCRDCPPAAPAGAPKTAGEPMPIARAPARCGALMTWRAFLAVRREPDVACVTTSRRLNGAGPDRAHCSHAGKCTTSPSGAASPSRGDAAVAVAYNGARAKDTSHCAASFELKRWQGTTMNAACGTSSAGAVAPPPTAKKSFCAAVSASEDFCDLAVSCSRRRDRSARRWTRSMAAASRLRCDFFDPRKKARPGAASACGSPRKTESTAKPQASATPRMPETRPRSTAETASDAFKAARASDSPCDSGGRTSAPPAPAAATGRSIFAFQ
mmetsp:Transcript_31371/g.108458  ORF Transcript_31371/g.108458 Transcript_31371/m.108458 type:complete len:273 (+) Transcript_31371:380-1198(+)